MVWCMTNFGSYTNKGLAIAGAIIGTVVLLAIIAAMIGIYFSSVADTNAVFTDENTTTGNDTADSLLPIFPILIAFAALFGIVGLVLAGVALATKGK